MQALPQVFRQGRIPVSAELAAVFVASTRELVDAGVRVFGFRPPVSAHLERFENELFEFDLPAFVRAFEEAGARPPSVSTSLWAYLAQLTVPISWVGAAMPIAPMDRSR